MTHKITFRDVETGWHNALPLGNGKMGAMVWYEGRALHIALNHYDCYYQVLQESGGTGFDDPALRENRYEELKSRIDRERQRPGYDRSHYARTINPPSDGRPLYTGGSYPQGGEITVHFAGEIDTEHTLLELCIEEAKVTFAAGDKERRIGASVWVAAGCDCVMAELSQTEAGLWETPRLTRQNARGQGGYEYEDIASESGMLTMRCRFRKSREAQEKEPFVQETAVYFPDQADGNTGDKTGLLLTASVQPGAGAAERMAETGYRERDKEAAAHREEWRSFWKSTVSLPDRYLETLWHLYVYLLGCCSGAGSIYSDQACGLSGLWDIRRPCMWGSMWYWDVNIQTAFYGAFGSNHMEQAKVFCDAFLSYREKARRFAERIYGTDGWALDYPHMFYNCIQPWCALFLWNYYAYTLDEDFLKDRAYPAFKEILDFYRKMGRTDEKGIRHLDYDICPEQGPAASDTVITTAALKQLTVYALRSAEILGRPEKEKEELREMISQFPAYPLTGDGRRWKDSAAVQDDIYLRHPSVLMPVFPAEEIHMNSPEALRRTADETIRYAAGNTEPGTFGFVWIAAAAARMGAGESAVRILYENGLDYVTHSNGLGYEESERFINYCHLTKPANYLPVMCEEAGGVTAAVNFMLLQEIDGILHIFPALPDGNDRCRTKKTQYAADDPCVSGKYGPWENCGFEGLLAPGGLEVSAQMKDGAVVWLRIRCRKESSLALAVPTELGSSCGGDRILKRKMAAGEVLELGEKQDENECGENRPEVLVRRAARTHRRTFIGEDPDTAYYKAIDSMVCPYGYADTLRYPMTPLVLDFTEQEAKNYDPVYEKQIIEAGRSVLYAGGPRAVRAGDYCAHLGYGFLKPGKDKEPGKGKTGVRIVCRSGPDALRQDFAEGSETAVFAIELPAGKYDLLMISGDGEEPSCTGFEILECGVSLTGTPVPAGRYQCRIIPVIHPEDGLLKIGIRSGHGLKWKLNAIFVNKEYMFL